MKGFVFILLLSFLAIDSYSQKGFKVIHKAEIQYKKGNYNRSLRLLEKAKKRNYHFCGNAAIEAHREIYFLKVKNYIEKENYRLALKNLQSIHLHPLEGNYDSLKMRICQMEFGKDSIKSIIDSSLLNVGIEDKQEIYYITVPILNSDLILEFVVNTVLSLDLGFAKNDSERIKIWIEEFKKSKNYKMLQEGI